MAGEIGFDWLIMKQTGLSMTALAVSFEERRRAVIALPRHRPALQRKHGKLFAPWLSDQRRRFQACSLRRAKEAQPPRARSRSMCRAWRRELACHHAELVAA